MVKKPQPRYRQPTTYHWRFQNFCERNLLHVGHVPAPEHRLHEPFFQILFHAIQLAGLWSRELCRCSHLTTCSQRTRTGPSVDNFRPNVHVRILGQESADIYRVEAVDGLLIYVCLPVTTMLQASKPFFDPSLSA